jgi:putative ABC transport system ATP-binding protein
MANYFKSDHEKHQTIIKADNIHKTYLFGLEGVAALRGVSVHIRQGDFVIILGNSGGGKTSLLNILGTIDKQTKVKIILKKGNI